MKVLNISIAVFTALMLLLGFAGCSKSKYDKPMRTAQEQKAAADTETERAREHIARIEKKLGKNHPEAKALRAEYGIQD